VRDITAIKLNFKRSISNICRLPYEILKLYKTIKQQKPDIVHLNSSKMGVIGAIAAKIAKVEHIIYTVHGFVFNEPMSKFSKKLYISAEKFSARFKKKLICVSEYDKNQGLKNKIAAERKFITIHNGISSNLKFLSKEDAKNYLNISSEQVIGTIANFYPTKDLITYIKVASEVTKKFPNSCFVIIGDGIQRKEIESLISSLNLEGKIILAGYKIDAYKYLAAFDIYLCTSVKEGFPLSILEATIAQVPIVTTNAGGIPEMIQNDYNGILTNIKDSKAMSEAVIRLMTDKDRAQRMAKAGYNKTVNEFGLNLMIKKTSQLYNMLPRS